MDAHEEKADLLDLLLDATNAGVVDWDIANNRVRYNERWRFLLGWDEEGFDLAPDTWRALVHEDERADMERALTDHLEHQWPFVQTVRMRHRSQGWRWIVMRGTSRRNQAGAPQRMVIVFTDIDERVRAESQVRALVEAIPDAIVRTRSDGTVLAVKEGSRLQSASDAQGAVSHGLWAAIRGSEAGAAVMAAIRSAGEHAQVAQVACRLRNPSGEAVDYDVRIVRSGVDEAVCIIRDVTREKRIEEQLARGRKLEAIGQLAAGLAHEVNTPLQYIGDNLQFVKDAIPLLLALLDDYQAAVRSGPRIAQAAVQMGRVVRAMRTFEEVLGEKEQQIDLAFLRESLGGSLASALDGMAQIGRIVRALKIFEDGGRQERGAVELNPIVENATTAASHAWREVAELVLLLAPDLPLVPCVAGEIAQVVLQLVVNAAQAVADKVGGSGRKGRITIETVHDRTRKAVEIRVTDDGVGIPEAIRGRVFDPFFTTRPVGQGTGQGLAQVHSAVVGLHGGSVHFDSRVGEGSCFVVSLPLAAAGVTLADSASARLQTQ